MSPIRYGCLALVCVFAAASAIAQDKPAAAGSALAADALAEFNKQASAWKDQLATLRNLQIRYQKASMQDRVALSKEHDAVVATTKAMLPKMAIAAERAYSAAPNQNNEVAAFLYSSIQAAVARDDDEEALRLARVMIDQQFPEKGIYELAGLAAYRVGEFEAAETYLREAASASRLAEQGQKLLAELPRHQDHWRVEKLARDAEVKANNLPRVKMSIVDGNGQRLGDIVLELFENEAPNTVANFISLVESGFYNGLKFHRVLPGFMAQGGDPKGDGTGGPGYTIACECYGPNYRRHFRGSLSMALSPTGRDTGGSQFFITFNPTEHLDGKHTVFGRVVEGLDVLPKLQRVDPNQRTAVTPDKIASAVVVRKRPGKKYEPQKLQGAGAGKTN